MKKKEKINYIISKLEELYPSTPIPLKHKDTFTLLIAVLLSARCTDERVNKITPILFQKADSPEKMIKLSVEEIRQIIRPCGLSPQKSKAIFSLSKILIEKYNSIVPDNFEDLESLPGVGHKTASVVMCQAFNKEAFPVDTHIFRLMRRWGISKGKSVQKVEKDSKKVFPKELWSKLHLQIIFFGREFCPSRSHNSNNCPICSVVNNKYVK